MVSICPTITVENKEDFTEQISTATKLSKRIHIDVSDGSLAPRHLLGIGQMRWPKNVKADLHIMSKQPTVDVAIAIHLRPHLVILHAEAQADFFELAVKLHNSQIDFGIALLQTTSPTVLAPIIHEVDHVLIFSGNLGYQGGSAADLALLSKIALLKEMKPALEIGWDGGVNDTNINQLVRSGVDVINVGGFIQQATEPKQAYAKLKKSIKN